MRRRVIPGLASVGKTSMRSNRGIDGKGLTQLACYKWRSTGPLMPPPLFPSRCFSACKSWNCFSISGADERRRTMAMYTVDHRAGQYENLQPPSFPAVGSLALSSVPSYSRITLSTTIPRPLVASGGSLDLKLISFFFFFFFSQMAGILLALESRFFL